MIPKEFFRYLPKMPLLKREINLLIFCFRNFLQIAYKFSYKGESGTPTSFEDVEVLVTAL